MSFVRSVLATTTLVAGAVTISLLLPDLAHAQCAMADQCSPQECARRQRLVHPACDKKRSCTKISASNTPKLERYLLRNEQCLSARLSVQECFSRPDLGHQAAIQSAQNAYNTCETKLNQN